MPPLPTRTPHEESTAASFGRPGHRGSLLPRVYSTGRLLPSPAPQKEPAPDDGNARNANGDTQFNAWMPTARYCSQGRRRPAGSAILSLTLADVGTRGPRLGRPACPAPFPALAVEMGRMGRERGTHGLVIVKCSAGRGRATPYLVTMTAAVWQDIAEKWRDNAPV